MKSKLALFAFVVATVLVPASAMGMASAELYSTKSYFYGRFDARIQFAPGDGVVSSFFLWKEGSDASNAYWNELDYEKYGSDCKMQLNNIYGNPKSQHQQNPSIDKACSQYHDYRFEWTPTYIAWVVDGKEIRRDTGTNATAYAQNATAGMSFHFNIWPGNSSFGGNINNTTLPVHQYISWVEYSSYDNGNFNVEWHEDFQSSDVPSGWGVGNWSSPFNLSTHNTQNVGFVNGIAVLSLTADNATGNPGTPPVDTSAGGSGGGTGGSGAGGVTSSGGSGAGGTTASGGTTGSGGKTSGGGAGGSGGSAGSGGATSKGGSGGGGSGGSAGAGGASQAGGTTSSGGSAGGGGRTSTTGAGGTTTGAGGTTTSGPGGSTTSGAGGTTTSGGTTASSTTTTGGATGGGNSSSSGCDLSSANRSSSPSAALLFFAVALAISRLRRKQL